MKGGSEVIKKILRKAAKIFEKNLKMTKNRSTTMY